MECELRKERVVGLTKTFCRPRVKLTSSFLSEVISSVDALHKHRAEKSEEEGGSGALVLKKRADSKQSPLNLISSFYRQAQIRDSVAVVNWENIMINGFLLVFSPIIHDSNNTTSSNGNDACVRMHH